MKLRDAAVHLAGYPARLTLTKLTENAFRAELRRLKQLYNEGRDFPRATKTCAAVGRLPPERACTMDVHPDAVLPEVIAAAAAQMAQTRLDAPADRDAAAAQLRARLLKMIKTNELRKAGSNDSVRPR